jgi:hypothetical protein
MDFTGERKNQFSALQYMYNEILSVLQDVQYNEILPICYVRL